MSITLKQSVIGLRVAAAIASTTSYAQIDKIIVPYESNHRFCLRIFWLRSPDFLNGAINLQIVNKFKQLFLFIQTNHNPHY